MKTPPSFYSQEELQQLGFKKLGKNILLSRKTSVYAADQIEIGDNCRIDDFCILSGKITLGRFIHMSPYASCFAGEAGIFADDFSAISSRSAVYAISDDLSGEFMVGPTIPSTYRNVTNNPVYIGKFAAVCTGCTLLPGARMGEGAVLGIMSLLQKEQPPWTIYAGTPARFARKRTKTLLDHHAAFEDAS